MRARRVDLCQREKDYDMQNSRDFRDFDIRRRDMGVGAAATAAIATVPSVAGAQAAGGVPRLKVSFTVNGKARELELDTRTTLLDALRESLHLAGTKKGCDHGQCGACTVIVDGRRINSCLTLAVMHQGGSITTVEGLGTRQEMHPMQTSFIKHDGFQCGYCTPGQICSAVALMDEAKNGEASYVTNDVRKTSGAIKLSDEEI